MRRRKGPSHNMTPRQSFEILELKHHATLDDAHRAYKDMAIVWHPDRFGGNPRLKQKAEQKLKEINEAYETVKAYIDERMPSHGAPTKKEPSAQPAPERTFEKREKNAQERSSAGIAAEVGTLLILRLFSYISKKIHRFEEKDPL